MVKADARPEKESYSFLTLYYGDNLSTVVRYTDWDRPVSGFTSVPSMDLTVPDNTGTFGAKELRVLLPLDPLIDRLSNGVPHSPVFAVLQEVTAGLTPGDQAAVRTLYTGRVENVVRNFQGRGNQAALFVLTQKSRLDISLGLSCNFHCTWTLFKGGCGVVESSFDIDTDINSADGQQVTIVDAAVQGAASGDDRYWKRGYMEKDGLRIGIRDYDGSVDDTVFQMTRAVPFDWIGGAGDIRIVPGCDKTVETCRSRFNAEEFFMGMGYGMLPYQPNYETDQ